MFPNYDTTEVGSFVEFSKVFGIQTFDEAALAQVKILDTNAEGDVFVKDYIEILREQMNRIIQDSVMPQILEYFGRNDKQKEIDLIRRSVNIKRNTGNYFLDLFKEYLEDYAYTFQLNKDELLKNTNTVTEQNFIRFHELNTSDETYSPRQVVSFTGVTVPTLIKWIRNGDTILQKGIDYRFEQRGTQNRIRITQSGFEIIKKLGIRIHRKEDDNFKYDEATLELPHKSNPFGFTTIKDFFEFGIGCFNNPPSALSFQFVRAHFEQPIIFLKNHRIASEASTLKEIIEAYAGISSTLPSNSKLPDLVGLITNKINSGELDPNMTAGQLIEYSKKLATKSGVVAINLDRIQSALRNTNNFAILSRNLAGDTKSSFYKRIFNEYEEVFASEITYFSNHIVSGVDVKLQDLSEEDLVLREESFRNIERAIDLIANQVFIRKSGPRIDPTNVSTHVPIAIRKEIELILDSDETEGLDRLTLEYARNLALIFEKIHYLPVEKEEKERVRQRFKTFLVTGRLMEEEA